MRIGAGSNRSVVAFLAALVFVVQTSFVAWAGAAVAAGPTLDAFGNPLCITSHEVSGSTDGDHGKVPSCCTLGCASVAPVLDQPAGTAVLVLAAAHTVSVPAPDGIEPGLKRLDHDIASPRGPPSAL
ncbi:MAG: hypothetical protein AB7S80_10595 [Rhizobiaceae bacterium]